jgi:hypothetical protein
VDQAGDDLRKAGDVHEDLWNRLLSREDPRFHNVRVARGDGGIDGFVLKDPLFGHASDDKSYVGPRALTSGGFSQPL